MGIFGFKRQTEKTGDKRKASSVTSAPVSKKSSDTIKPSSKKGKTAVSIVAPVGGFSSGTTDVVIKPHITEKTGLLSRNGTYTFQVTKNANKSSVATAVHTLYKVTPVKVAIVNLPNKNVFVRGKRGIVSGVRKAVVTIKKGEKIDFV